MDLYGTITEQNDSMEVTPNRFANFAEEEKLEFFGLLMKIMIS